MDHLIMSKKYWWGLLAAVLFSLLFMNTLLPVTDNVESNYALTAKEMVLSGDWISPQIYGRYWYDKPVMFYWLTALAFKVFGFTNFAARLAPALFGFAAVAFTGWSGRKLISERGGFLSAFILSSFIMFFAISKLIITDAILFLFFNATLIFFYLGYSTPCKNWYYGMYICAGLSTLTKGPIGFLLPGLILILFLLMDRGWRELRTARLLSGFLLFLAVVLPWYGAMYYLHGSDFVNTFLGLHNMVRATVSEHPRDNVIYYYTVLLLGMAFPWISFLPQAVKYYVHPSGSWQKPPRLELFLFLSAATVFFFFQNMATKYPTYTYPLLLPLALLLGSFLDKTYAEGKNSFKFYGPLSWNSLFTIILALAALLYKNNSFELWQPVLLTLVLLGGLIMQWRLRKQGLKFIYAIGLTSLIFHLLLTSCLISPLTRMRSADNLTPALQKLFPQRQEFISYGNYPTSAVYYGIKTIYRAQPDATIAANAKASGSPGSAKQSWSGKNVMPVISYSSLAQQKQPVMVVDEKYFTDFQQEFAVKDQSWILQAQIPGWQIWERKQP